MKAFIALTVIGLASVAYLGLFSEDTTLNSEFQNFIQTHKVSYANSAEYEFRQKAFEKNLEKIARLNKANPLATFGINKFADRTEEELESMLTKRSSDDNGSCKAYTPEGSPKTISWADFMGAYKDQGNCGACWCFASAAVAEGRYAISQGITDKVTTRFAEQQLLDCNGFPQMGCNGGVEARAFQFYQKNDICLQDGYEYKAKKGKCQKCSTGIRATSCTNLAKVNSEIVTELQSGPVDIGVDASSWPYYTGGIMTDCSGRGNNHAVTLVGFNSNEGTVSIRNSWGGDWGENGLIRLDYSNNACGWTGDAHSLRF
uniref:Uncharacterized protein n=1 Tax=Euplotes crassus TaxID=5936 RepID=A0A7S3KUS4_EUPCR|mmetsp:Transcript_9156/g.8768  ORF Transcript_9156/g.8768 Transcript_9156/m.8768 type:complete len:316 (+) Transcript_9156:22-969(+)